MIAWTDVVNLAPEMSTVPVGMQSAILGVVQRQVNVGEWGQFANDGMCYLAAHLAAISGDEGMITEERLGAMARSYSLPPGIKGSLALSSYGAEYLRLIALLPASLGLVP